MPEHSSEFTVLEKTMSRSEECGLCQSEENKMPEDAGHGCDEDREDAFYPHGCPEADGRHLGSVTQRREPYYYVDSTATHT